MERPFLCQYQNLVIAAHGNIFAHNHPSGDADSLCPPNHRSEKRPVPLFHIS